MAKNNSIVHLLWLQILSSYFVIEIIARIHAVTSSVFFSRKWWFNTVDFIVVVLSFAVSLSVTIVVGTYGRMHEVSVTTSHPGRGGGQVVSSSPSTPTIRVRIPLTNTVFSVKFVFEKNENKQKEAGVSPFFKKPHICCSNRLYHTLSLSHSLSLAYFSLTKLWSLASALFGV